MSILPVQPAPFVYNYNEEITEAQLVTYLDEIATEQVIALEDLPEATIQYKYPVENTVENDFLDSSIPSNIPGKINKLNKFFNRPENPDSTEVERVAVYKLKNVLVGDYILPEGYNGICVDLDTTSGTLIIPLGSTIAAL